MRRAWPLIPCSRRSRSGWGSKEQETFLSCIAASPRPKGTAYKARLRSAGYGGAHCVLKGRFMLLTAGFSQHADRCSGPLCALQGSSDAPDLPRIRRPLRTQIPAPAYLALRARLFMSRPLRDERQGMQERIPDRLASTAPAASCCPNIVRPGDQGQRHRDPQRDRHQPGLRIRPVTQEAADRPRILHRGEGQPDQAGDAVGQLEGGLPFPQAVRGEHLPGLDRDLPQSCHAGIRGR